MTQSTSGRVSREKRGHIILLGLDQPMWLRSLLPAEKSPEAAATLGAYSASPESANRPAQMLRKG
jgi:hypothetical protein